MENSVIFRLSKLPPYLAGGFLVQSFIACYKTCQLMASHTREKLCVNSISLEDQEASMRRVYLQCTNMQEQISK